MNFEWWNNLTFWDKPHFIMMHYFILCCWIQFTNTLWRICTSMLIRRIGPNYFPPSKLFSCFCIRVMLTSQNDLGSAPSYVLKRLFRSGIISSLNDWQDSLGKPCDAVFFSGKIFNCEVNWFNGYSDNQIICFLFGGFGRFFFKELTYFIYVFKTYSHRVVHCILLFSFNIYGVCSDVV